MSIHLLEFVSVEPIAGGEAVYTQRENQTQEGRQYIPSVRTNRKRGGSIYPAGEAVYTQREHQSQVFVDLGVDLEERNNDALTALDYAVRANQQECVDALLSAMGKRFLTIEEHAE
eukprot:1188264-Prorocentrum_minimum.AAC.1